MYKSQKFILILVAISVTGCGVWVGWTASMFGGSPTPKANGIIFNESRSIDGFQLTDHYGKMFDNERLKNQWSLIYFGYTNCPDFCPMALAQFALLNQELASDAHSLQYIFVSVDPYRDTLDRLKQYVEFFFPELIGVTGSESQLKKFSTQLAVAFNVANTERKDYPVDHSNTILLVNPNGEFQAVFTAPHKAQRLATDFQAIQDWYSDSN